MEVKPGYKQTEVGVIPEEWETAAVADLVEPSAPICYGVVQVGQHTESGVPIVAIKFVKEIAHAPLHRTAVNLEQPYERSRPKGGDVLISIKGTIGRVGIVPNGFQGNISRELARLRIRKGSCPEYIAHQLESGATQERIMRSVVGTTRLEFSIATLRKFPLPVPPTLPEQRAIAAVLSDVDGLLGGLDRLIAKKRDLKQAAMQQLLTGQTRLPGFSGAWEVTQVRGVVREGKQTQRQAGTGEEAGSYRFFTNNTQNNATFLNQYDFDGEAVIANTGGSAYFQHYRGKFAASMHCLILLPQINAKFLYYALKLRELLINESCFQGSGLKVLNKESLRELVINLPKSAEEQSGIAAVLTDIDVELAALEARREKTAQLKQGMMQELLTGKIRLLQPEALNA
jgi:type I restriction enzyme S subunit